MKFCRSPRLCLPLILLALLAVMPPAHASLSGPTDPRLDPAPGMLILASGGRIPEGALRLAVETAGGIETRLVVLANNADRLDRQAIEPWERAGVEHITPVGLDQVGSDTAVLQHLLRATALWVVDPPRAEDRELLLAIIDAVRSRGGAVYAHDASAAGLVGLGVLPGASIAMQGQALASDPALAEGQVPVTWRPSPGTAMVVHRGRVVSAVGEGTLSVSVPATRGWRPLDGRAEATGLDTPDASASYDFDLLRWNRAARLRETDKPERARAAEPRVQRGTLLICGGSTTTGPMYDAFIEAAGGTEAKFVYIPTASTLTDAAEQSYSTTRALAERGCTNVTVFHTTRRARAQHDPALLALLEQADGVFLGGGRTYRYVDAYLDTQTHAKLRSVLERGGVIAGSSAGAQILGELLVRGDPRTNQNILFHGYTDGFGFLPGVAIDAHFTQRERQEPFYNNVLKRHNHLLGIGIDERTAILVKQGAARVIGENAVVFYNLLGPAPDDAQGTVLNDGESYDLVNRRRIDTPPGS